MRSWASTGVGASTLCTLRRLLRTMGGISSLAAHLVVTQRDGHQYSRQMRPETQKTPSVQSAGGTHVALDSRGREQSALTQGRLQTGEVAMAQLRGTA